MKLSELLNCPPIHEDYADAIPDQMPDFDPRHAKVIGNNDGRDVWGSRCWKSIDVYAYRTGNRVDAFIAVSPKKNKMINILLYGHGVIHLYVERAWCLRC